MKTIVIYATKYGAAGEVAQRIADRISGAVVHNLNQGIPSITEFDRIIIGSSLYAGAIRKEVKEFLLQNADVLHKKILGLFLCGISTDGEKTYFDANFSPGLLQKAKTTCFLGGIFDPDKAGMIERLIIKMVAQKSTYTDTIDDEKIERFAEAMKA